MTPILCYTPNRVLLKIILWLTHMHQYTILCELGLLKPWYNPEHIAPTSASFRAPSHQYINGETGVIDFEISASNINCSIHIGGAPFSTILFDPTISCNSRSWRLEVYLMPSVMHTAKIQHRRLQTPRYYEGLDLNRLPIVGSRNDYSTISVHVCNQFSRANNVWESLA